MLRASYNLNGHPSLKGASKMRVFCPEHKRGFFAPRQSPIKCENRGHLLGEIDFEGQARTPVELQWQYCCNCEHFCPADFDQYGLQRCPVCTRKSSVLYVCDKCYVISFESNTPLQTKNFTLTADGAPQPSCPGCLRLASTDLHEHTCDEVHASFITGLSVCPICNDRLDLAPAFPATVADYLKRTKAANKINVTFDYESGVFVPVEDGEFVVITSLDQPVVLPRATKFAAKRDFYEYYQDYYHCPNPDAGDVQILQPALVTRTANGWSLTGTGLLDVVKPQPKQRPVVTAPVVQPPPPPTAAKHEEPETLPTPPKAQPGLKTCSGCGAQIESKYAFCWKCGNAMDSEHHSSTANSRKPPMMMSSQSLDLDDEMTVQTEPRPSGSTMLSWTDARTPERHDSQRRSVLKLLVIAAIAFTLVSVAVFGLLRSSTQTASATVETPAEQTAASQPQPQASVPMTTEVSRAAPAETTTQQAAQVTPEDELKKLREKRMTAKASERPHILQALAKVEKQYPRDYRFPYERAKLAVKGSQRAEAFKALNTAAQKAITTGKANEMLNGLETDKAGDFNKLSQTKIEWTRLVAALKKKDTSLLGE